MPTPKHVTPGKATTIGLVVLPHFRVREADFLGRQAHDLRLYLTDLHRVPTNCGTRVDEPPLIGPYIARGGPHAALYSSIPRTNPGNGPTGPTVDSTATCWKATCSF